MKAKGENNLNLLQTVARKLPTSRNRTLADASKMAMETDNLISKGLSKSTASTGTPISELKGMAKILAQTANIGGGSVKTGGGGVKAGVNIVGKNIQAKTFIKAAGNQIADKKKKK